MVETGERSDKLHHKKYKLKNKNPQKGLSMIKEWAKDADYNIQTLEELNIKKSKMRETKSV